VQTKECFTAFIFQDIIVEVPLINGEPPATLNSSTESDASNILQSEVSNYMQKSSWEADSHAANQRILFL
jgi:hypothetical protein